MSTEDHPTAEAPRRRWRLARWRVAIGVALGLLLLLGVLVWPFYRDGTEAEYQAMRARLVAAGEPMEMADLFGPPPPPEENGAELLREADAWLQANPDAWRLIAAHWALPHNWAELEPEKRDALRAELTALRPYFDLVERAVERPRLRFHDPIAGDSLVRDMNEISLIQALVKCASARARRGEDARERLEAVRVQLAVGARWEDTDTAIQGLVASTISRAAIRLLRDLIEGGDVDAGAALAALRPFLSVDWRARHERSVRADRLELLRLKEILMGEAVAQVTSPELEEMKKAYAHGGAWFGHGARLGGVRYCHGVQDFLESSGGSPTRQPLIRDLRRDLEPDFSTVFVTPGSIMWRVALIIAPRVHMMSVDAEASCRLALTALTASVQRERTGRWPESLDEVAAELPPDTCIDPFSGEPFLFERLEKGLRLRSVGPNDTAVWDAKARMDAEEMRDSALIWELTDR